MKFIYTIYHLDGPMKLYEFIICFRILMLILAQLPSFHSLRHINMISLFLCFVFGACGGDINRLLGSEMDHTPGKEYSVVESRKSKLFGVFNSISIITFTYGNRILPKIHVHKIYVFSMPNEKGAKGNFGSSCYKEDVKRLVVVLSTYYSIMILGY
eukprot:Gb_24252 [translate_table: standard]